MSMHYTGSELQLEPNASETAFVNEMSEELSTVTYIDPALYPKYNVKRGLRNANNTGVVVALTRVGDAEGYSIDENGVKHP
jgi:citrate synthase